MAKKITTQKVAPVIKTGLGRGHKACQTCGTATGPRAIVCKKCKTPFSFKGDTGDTVKVTTNGITTTVKKLTDWKSLTRGDFIRVLQGSGPYFLNKQGEKVYVGAKGIYSVFSINDIGINAYAYSQGVVNGYELIRMVDDSKTPYGLVRNSHRIVRVKKRS